MLSRTLREDCETSSGCANCISNAKITQTGAFEQHQIPGSRKQIVICLYLGSLGKHASRINSVMIINLI